MPKKQEKVTRSDFEFIGLIGQGSFGKVFLAQDICSKQHYAIKVLDKK